MQQPKSTASWRDSARSSRLWMFDSAAFFPFLIMLFHIRWWTCDVFLTVATVVALTTLRYYGYSIRVFGRIIISFLAGKRKLATPWWM